MSAAQVTADNTAQAEYWNSGAGQRWTDGALGQGFAPEQVEAFLGKPDDAGTTVDAAKTPT
jgi:hypothetical protein